MKRKLTIAPALILLGLLAVVPALPAGAGMYMKLGDIKGESTAADDSHKDWINLDSLSAADKEHQGWIDIESLSTSMNVSPTLATAGAGTSRSRGDAIVEAVTVTKKVDKASPKLSEAVCKGKVIPKVDVYLTSTYGGARSETYYRYEMQNVRVTSYSVSAGSAAGDRPTETITLNFEKIKVGYDKQAKKKGNVETEWKVEKGEK